MQMNSLLTVLLTGTTLLLASRPAHATPESPRINFALNPTLPLDDPLTRLDGWQGVPLTLADAASPASMPSSLRDQLTAANERRITLMKYGMGSLVTWAVGNIAVGVVGNIVADDDQTRAFHQGNWGWNIVNLVIGGIGLYNAFKEDPSALTVQQTYEKKRGARLAFAINSALDCIYMATGAWLWERGIRTDEPIMTGWGQALVLQGGFLLVYDLVMWGLTFNIPDIPVEIHPTVGGAMLSGRF